MELLVGVLLEVAASKAWQAISARLRSPDPSWSEEVVGRLRRSELLALTDAEADATDRWLSREDVWAVLSAATTANASASVEQVLAPLRYELGPQVTSTRAEEIASGAIVNLMSIVTPDIAATISTFRSLAADLSDLKDGQVFLADLIDDLNTEIAQIRSSASSGAASVTDSASIADAVVRGPIRHLGLDESFDQARALSSDEPLRAADLFGQIAAQLEESPFLAHALRLRTEQAEALSRGGDNEGAISLRLDLGWHYLTQGEPFMASQQLQKISKGGELPDAQVRAAYALDVCVNRRREHGVRATEIASKFDEMHPSDPHRLDTALFLAEACIEDGDTEIIQARHSELVSIVSNAPVPLLHSAVRLRCCLADANNEWPALVEWARSHCDDGLLAHVLARHARFLALHLDADRACERYLEAIERACRSRLFDDAAGWLYALRAVRVLYGLVSEDLNDAHFLAQALRSSGSGSLLPQPFSPRERALSAIRDEKWPDALEALHRYLWHSTVSGSWSAELDAHELLGDLYRATGQHLECFRQFVSSGKEKKLRSVVTEIPDAPLTVDRSLLTPRTWERSATYSLVEAAADLLTDEAAMEWASQCAADVLTPSTIPVRAFVSDPWLAAFKAFGQVSDATTVEDALQFVQFAAHLVEREPNRYRFTDEAHVDALVGIARTHGEARPPAVTQLLDGLTADQTMADRVLSKGSDLLREEAALVAERLGDIAASGDRRAALAMIIAEADTTSVVPMATAAVNAAIQPIEHQPGVQHIGTGLGNVALLATTLEVPLQIAFARAMMARALDARDHPSNRAEALGALAAVATGIDDSAASSLFADAIDIAQGEEEDTPAEDPFAASLGPFSRFRFDLGGRSLQGPGLRAAAALARDPEAYRSVQRLGLVLLQTTGDSASYDVAHALSRIPTDEVTIDLPTLATHSSPWLRALAAVVWSARTDMPPELGVRLARDPSPRVRSSLASSLIASERLSEVRQVLLDDPRRSIRRRARGTANALTT